LLPASVVADLTAHLGKGDHLLVAEELIDGVGLDEIRDFLKTVFGPDGIVPSMLHELIAATPVNLFLTTNYDNLLERAFSQIHGRYIERILLTDMDKLVHLPSGQKAIVKLHGDIDVPETVVLGQRRYQKLVGSEAYSSMLQRIFSENSVLMLGYSLGDPDITLALDRLAASSRSTPPHYMLSVKGSRTGVEKKRLARDRNVHVLEYIDYFGFHNHVDTFLVSLNLAAGNTEKLSEVRHRLRARVIVHYPLNLKPDGEFVWNFIFREGAVPLSWSHQEDQRTYFERVLEDELRCWDYVLLVVDSKALASGGDFRQLTERCLEVASRKGVQVLFLVIGVSERPELLAGRAQNPCFYLEDGFSEKDLLFLRHYISQDIAVGGRQP